MGEEFYVGVPNSDFPHCPVCNEAMIWYQDTLVCIKCDHVAVEDLTWCKKHIEGNGK